MASPLAYANGWHDRPNPQRRGDWHSSINRKENTGFVPCSSPSSLAPTKFKAGLDPGSAEFVPAAARLPTGLAPGLLSNPVWPVMPLPLRQKPQKIAWTFDSNGSVVVKEHRERPSIVWSVGLNNRKSEDSSLGSFQTQETARPNKNNRTIIRSPRSVDNVPWVYSTVTEDSYPREYRSYTKKKIYAIIDKHFNTTPFCEIPPELSGVLRKYPKRMWSEELYLIHEELQALKQPKESNEKKEA